MALASDSLEGKAEKYLQRIEALLGEVETAKGECGQLCKTLHEDVRSIYKEAKENGVPVRVLKGAVKYRQLEMQETAITVDMEIDEAAFFYTLIERLGPLGMAAARAAGHSPGLIVVPLTDELGAPPPKETNAAPIKNISTSSGAGRSRNAYPRARSSNKMRVVLWARRRQAAARHREFRRTRTGRSRRYCATRIALDSRFNFLTKSAC